MREARSARMPTTAVTTSRTAAVRRSRRRSAGRSSKCVIACSLLGHPVLSVVDAQPRVRGQRFQVQHRQQPRRSSAARALAGRSPRLPSAAIPNIVAVHRRRHRVASASASSAAARAPAAAAGPSPGSTRPRWLTTPSSDSGVPGTGVGSSERQRLDHVLRGDREALAAQLRRRTKSLPLAVLVRVVLRQREPAGALAPARARSCCRRADARRARAATRSSRSRARSQSNRGSRGRLHWARAVASRRPAVSPSPPGTSASGASAPSSAAAVARLRRPAAVVAAAHQQAAEPEMRRRRLGRGVDRAAQRPRSRPRGRRAPPRRRPAADAPRRPAGRRAGPRRRARRAASEPPAVGRRAGARAARARRPAAPQARRRSAAAPARRRRQRAARAGAAAGSRRVLDGLQQAPPRAPASASSGLSASQPPGASAPASRPTASRRAASVKYIRTLRQTISVERAR